MRKPIFSAIGLTLCAACTSNVITVPPATGGTHTNGAGSEGIPPSTTTSYPVLVGGTVPIAPGTQAGYALTAPSLMSYQLRWTGDAAVAADGYKEFYGSAWTTGHFTSLTPGCVNDVCPLEEGDYVSGVETVTGGERIDWDTFASDGWDGFGFTTDTEPVYFDVFIDGNRLPELVSFPVGANATPTIPASSPFGVTSSTN
jgi:hypothetical protein